MAIEFVESFDQGETLQWEVAQGAVVVSSPVLDSGRAVRFGALEYAQKVIPSSAEKYIGFFFQADNTQDTKAWFKFLKGATELAAVRFNASQKLEVVINSVIVATGTKVFVNNITYHLEIRDKVADAGGLFDVKVDGISDISFTGDTKPGADTQIDRIQIGTNQSLAPFTYFDSTIVQNDTFPGIVRMKTLFPDADGFLTAWSKSSGTQAFPLIDEAPPNDTDYVFSQTNAQQQSVLFPDHGLVGASIVAVVPTIVGKKISSGQIKLGLRRGEGAGGTNFMDAASDLGVANTHVQSVKTQDPSTSLAWVLADVNDLELVVEAVVP